MSLAFILWPFLSYNGVWTFDHDDGSQFMNDTANVMLFGGCKNYLVRAAETKATERESEIPD